MAIKLSASRAGSPLPPGRLLVLISVGGCVGPRGTGRLEGLSQLKKFSDPSACSIVPQPTTLLRAPLFYSTDDELVRMCQEAVLTYFRGRS
jgi:hypothetical protein